MHVYMWVYKHVKDKRHTSVEEDTCGGGYMPGHLANITMCKTRDTHLWRRIHVEDKRHTSCE
jgi:hypothetical protein